MIYFRFVIGLAALQIAMPAEATAYVPNEPRVLTSRERLAVESLACLQRHKVNAEDMQAFWLRRYSGQTAIRVAVRCASHGSQLSDPAFYEVNCIGKGASWECGESRLMVRISMQDRTYEVHSSTDQSLAAVAIVKGLAAQGHYFGQRPRKTTEACYVEALRPSDVYRVTCHGWQSLVSTWCPQKTCPRLLESAPMWR